MAFPTTPLQVRVDLNLGGAWTNVTSDTYANEKITITRGRQDETSSAQASAATFVLNNRSGKYTPKNPNGIYYGQLGRNTPVRIGVGVPPAGTATGGQSGTSIVAPSVVAETAGVVLSMYAQQSNAVTLTGPAGYVLTTQQVGASATGLTSLTAAKVATAGTVPTSTTTSTGSAPSAACSIFIPGPAGGVTSVTPANGTYSFFNSAFGPTAQTSNITVAAGDVLIALVAWSADARDAMVTAPIDQTQSVEWTLVADSGGPTSGTRVQAWARYCPVADSTVVQAPGECYGLNDTQMVVYRVTGAASWNPRYTGACADFSTTADLSGNDIRTTIAAGQILRQRGQGQQALNSCLYRYLTDKQPLAYWPLETGTLGGVFNSPIAGVQPAIPFAVSPGADSASFIASDALPQTAGNGSIAFPIPAYTAAANQAGSLFFAANITGVAGNPSTFFSVKLRNDGTAATIASIAIQYVGPTDVRFVLVNGAGAAAGTIFFTTNVLIPTLAGAISGGSVTGLPLGFFIAWNPNPTNPATQTDYRFTTVTTNGIVGPGDAVGIVGTCGQVYQVGAALDQYLANTMNTVCTFGHVTFDPFAFNVAASTLSIPQTRVFPNQHCSDIVGAFPSEPVSLRLRRICQDESIFLSSPILASESTDTSNIRHGPQPISNGLDLLALTQTTDGGELAEARGFNGFLYRPLGSLGSRPVVQALDYSAKMIADPFAPATDDQLVRNDITISQSSGSSARATAVTGPLSSNPPPNGVGTYTSSLTVDVAQQARDLQQIANWNLAIGTYDAERFKEIRSLLEAVPASVTGLSLIDIGNHIQVVNTPAWIQTGPTDLLVIGLIELIGPVAEWEITYNGRPYGQFNVLRADGGDAFARLDSGSSTLTAGVASGATSLSITTTNKLDLWAATTPFDIVLSGERMTVTAVAGATSPQTFTVTRAVNGVTKAQVTGAPVHVFYATYLGLNGGS